MKKIVQSVICLLLLAGCKSNLPSNYLSFDDISYITRFPRIVKLDGEKIDLDLIGRQDMFIYDSLMIVSTSNGNGFWSFFTLPDFERKGAYLLRGNGPKEFLYPPYTGQAAFRSEKGRTMIYIADDAKGRLMKMDMSKTLESNDLFIENVCDTLPAQLFSYVYIDSTTCLCRTITSDQSKQLRFLIKDGRREIPACLEKLNRAQVIPNSGNHNTLSAITNYTQHRNMVVEMPVGLNSLNMYTPDGSFTRTLCIGKRLFNIDEIQDMDYWQRPYTFADIKLFDTFWGVLYIGETNKSVQTGRQNLPKIYLFDWQGRPKVELQLPHHATTFDIDLKNGSLYTLDHVTEDMYRYDFENIIDAVR